MAHVSPVRIDSRHDGFSLSALSAPAHGAKRGGVVVIQEIFGLSAHIAEMCALFADAGYDALAPGLFERVEPGFSAAYDPDGVAKGRAAVAATPWDQAAADVQSALDALPRPAFVVGFCYGGSAAWVAAARCTGLVAAACFYGRQIVNLIGETPRVPTLLHYGRRDHSIPLDDVEAVRKARPEAQIRLYDAGHGFCRKASPDYDAASAELALTRTLEWFAQARA